MTQEIIAVMPAAITEGLAHGWDGAPIETVTDSGLAAVLSAPMAKRSLFSRLTGDVKPVVSELVKRQKLHEHLLNFGDVLPVRPGVEVSPLCTRSFLQANARELRGLLGEFANHVQHQLTVGWDPAAALVRFGLHEAHPGSPAKLAEAAEALRLRLRADFSGILDATARDRIDQPVDGVETILNTVLLVNRRDTASLDRALEQIDAVWTEGLHLKLVGPLPVISFALLVVDIVDEAALRSACDQLDLKAPLDIKTIDAAFRAQVMRTHTDRTGLSVDMESIVRARDLLKRTLSAGGLGDQPLLLARHHRDGNAETPAPHGAPENREALTV